VNHADNLPKNSRQTWCKTESTPAHTGQFVLWHMITDGSLLIFFTAVQSLFIVQNNKEKLHSKTVSENCQSY